MRQSVFTSSADLSEAKREKTISSCLSESDVQEVGSDMSKTAPMFFFCKDMGAGMAGKRQFGYFLGSISMFLNLPKTG